MRPAFAELLKFPIGPRQVQVQASPPRPFRSIAAVSRFLVKGLHLRRSGYPSELRREVRSADTAVATSDCELLK